MNQIEDNKVVLLPSELNLKSAHKASIYNNGQICMSRKCGCFYCLAVFSARDVVSWTDGGQTAICPRCEIDSVIGDASGFPVVNPDFLGRMHDRWFGLEETG